MADPRTKAIRTVTEGLLDSSVQHATFLQRFKTSEVDDVLQFLDNDVLPSITNKIASRLERGLSVRGTNSLKQLEATVQKFMGTGMQSASNQVKESMQSFALSEGEFEARTTGKALKPFNVDYVAPSPEVLRQIVNTDVQGRSVDQWFQGIATNSRQRVMSQIGIGMASGESVQQIVQRIRGTRANGFKDGVLQTTRRGAESVVRTTITHISAQAREATYAANEDVINGVQWVSTLDSRTTHICMGLDGEVFPINEGIRPPAHFQCRSTTIPVLKSWKELGIDLDEAPAGTRASMDGQVPAKVTYGEWLKNQPRAVQDEALGPVRARLFRAGKVKIDRFTDNKQRKLNLTELRKREGLTPAEIRSPNQRRRLTERAELVATNSGDTVGLPSDWHVQTHVTKSGRKYFTYINENNVQFRSLSSAQAAVQAKPPIVPVKPPPVPGGKDRKPAGGLPDGWQQENRVTKSGRKYKVFVSPEGKQFRSLVSAQKEVSAEAKAKRLIDKPKIVLDPKTKLPITWKVEERTTSKGRKYKVYESPEGRRFQSLKQARLHAEKSTGKTDNELVKINDKRPEWKRRIEKLESMAKDVPDDLALRTERAELITTRGKLFRNSFARDGSAIRLTDKERATLDHANKRVAEIDMQIKRAKENRKKEVELAVFGDNPKPKWEVERMRIPESARKRLPINRMKAGEAWVTSAVNPTSVAVPQASGLPKHKLQYVQRKKRAHQVSGHTQPSVINLSRSSSENVVVHEWGHEIEDRVKGAKQLAVEFVNKRTANTPRVSLGKWGMRGEFGNADDFKKTFLAVGHSDYNSNVYASYAGKTYQGFGEGSFKGLDGTEVTSMGFELMHKDPVAFAKADPEWAEMIMKIMTGETGR